MLYWKQTPSWHLLITMLLRVPRVKMQSCKTSWKMVWCFRLERVHISGTDVNLYCDTSTPQPWPFTTTSFRSQVFDTLHRLSHPGANATVKLVSQQFVWPGVGKDCWKSTCMCTPCQQSKVTQHVKAPLRSFNLPSARFSHVHIDLVGPLPLSSGFRYCLMAIDRYTSWSEALPLTSPLKQSLKPLSPSALLVSAVPRKSQPTRAGNLRPAFSRLWIPSLDPL